MDPCFFCHENSQGRCIADDGHQAAGTDRAGRTLRQDGFCRTDPSTGFRTTEKLRAASTAYLADNSRYTTRVNKAVATKDFQGCGVELVSPWEIVHTIRTEPTQ